MNLPLFISTRLRNKQKTSFSATVYRIGVASIALGLTVMMVAFAVLFGFKSSIQRKLFSLAPHLRITKFSLNQSYEESPLRLDTTLLAASRKFYEVTHAQAVAHKPAILKTQSDLQGVLLKGVGRDFDWQNFGQNLCQGKGISLPDSGYSKEIVISQIIAKQLNLNVGDEVVLWFLQQPPRPRKLRVAGIYETGLEEFDKQLIVGDIALIQRLNNWDTNTVGAYEIFVKDLKQIEPAALAIANLLAPDMGLEKATERFRPILDWLELLDRNMVVFLSLILFVVSFNMSSILLVMMMERTAMIGLLKALGSTNWQIRKIFLFQGISMIIRGLLLGNLIGIGVCWLQYRFRLIPLDAESYYMNTVPIEWNFNIIVYLNLGVLLLVSLILLIPTVVITRIQPVRAIVFNK